MAGNKNLTRAMKAKNDEFYTRLTDIEKELRHYWPHFKDKVILCNCDDPFESNFFKFFVLNFNFLGLKKLIATCYKESTIANKQLSLFDVSGDVSKKGVPYKAIVTKVYDTTGDGGIDLNDVINLFKSGENELSELDGDGDFRSEECLELLKEADVVVTNPPFSLFREYLATLIKYDKKFLVIGNQNAITYKEVFPLLKNNDIWLGNNNPAPKLFYVPMELEERKNISRDEKGDLVASFGNICWFTNLDIKKRHEDIILFRHYNPEKYPKYDNYDAINVDKVKEIPCDYAEIMGVPITFLDKYNPEQFEIIGNACDTDWCREAGIKTMGQETIDKLRAQGNKAHVTANMNSLYIEKNGKIILPYARIIIRNKHPQTL